MALHGERADKPTYIDLREIIDGSNQLVRCSHWVLGADCVQKTVPIGADGAAFAEPRLLEVLDHPHIPPVREAQFDPDRRNCVTFVMPWYPGGSVARALVDGHVFSLHEALAIARDVLDALEYVHTVHNRVHRDVKTSNVLLDGDRATGYLTDFERAAQMESDRAAQAVLTTTFYMAPECALTGRHSVRSDVYGVGMILFEMLNGRFAWETFDPAEVEQRVLNGKRSFPDRVIAPTAFEPHVPPVLVRITRKALSRDPAGRFASARDFLTAINRVRAIDWRKTKPDDAEESWEGSWPPHVRLRDREHYRVSSRRLRSGPERGLLRLTAEIQRAGSATWRRFGIGEPNLGEADREGVRQFFNDVAARAAHRWPAR